MILVKITGKGLETPLIMSFPTGKMEIEDVYTLLGTKDTKQYSIWFMDYDYSYLYGKKDLEHDCDECDLLNWCSQGRAKLEELNYFAILWEKMNMRHIEMLTAYSKRVDWDWGMKRLINITYSIGRMKPDSNTDCVLKKSFIYKGKHLPIQPEDFVFQLQCRDNVLNFPTGEAEMADFFEENYDAEISRYYTVLTTIPDADLYDLHALNLLAQSYKALPGIKSRRAYLAKLQEQDIRHFTQALDVIQDMLQTTNSQENSYGIGKL